MNRIFFHQINQSDFQKLEKSTIYLHRPKIIGYYEYNHEEFMPAKRIKYLNELKPSDYPLNLNEGEENMVFTIPQPLRSRLHIPLHYAMSPGATIATTEDGAKLTPVYTSRRVLTQLMEVFYSRFDFVVNISRCNGSLYMAGLQSTILPKKLEVNHLRLEMLLFSDSPNKSRKQNESLDRNISLSSLHRTTLGMFDLIYAGEVQGIIAHEEFHKFDDLEALNKLRFVFSKQMFYVRDKSFKLLTYWLQSYLACVDDIYLAVKNCEGIVEEPIEHIKVSNIPKNCGSWKPQICAALLNDFLERVEQLMTNVDSLDTVYEFNFNARNKTFHYNVYEGKTDKSFIPQEYANFVTNNRCM